MSETARPGLPLDFRLLGPLTVVVGDSPVDLGGLRRKAVLAVLLAAGGTTVSESVVIDVLWGDRPSAGVRNNLQTHVSRLRAAHPDLASRLVRTGSGYRLHVEPGELDADRVDVLAASARAAPGPRDAAPLLERALAHWRGRPLDEFGDLPGWPGSSLAALQVRLDEVQEGLREDLLAALVAAGRHTEALPELEQAVARRPDHERAHRLLATALYRSGRAADALSALRRYRRRLADLSGLDPSPDLTDLEHQILVQDAGLAAPEAPPHPPTAQPPVPPVPAQFPRTPRAAGPSPVHGREADLDRLRGALATSALVTVTGPGGVGKTRLVRELLGQDQLRAAVVDLASAHTAADAVTAVAGVLDVRAGPGRPLEDAVVDDLGRGRRCSCSTAASTCSPTWAASSSGC